MATTYTESATITHASRVDGEIHLSQSRGGTLIVRCVDGRWLIYSTASEGYMHPWSPDQTTSEREAVATVYAGGIPTAWAYAQADRVVSSCETCGHAIDTSGPADAVQGSGWYQRGEGWVWASWNAGRVNVSKPVCAGCHHAARLKQSGLTQAEYDAWQRSCNTVSE